MAVTISIETVPRDDAITVEIPPDVIAPETLADAPGRSIVPPAFYRDDEPPEPPEGDPHWREFPIFESIRGSRLVVAAIILGVVFVCLAHLAVIFFT